MNRRQSVWTDEEVAIIYANYRTLMKKEIIQLIQDDLGIIKSYGQIKRFYQKNNLVSGIDCRFKQGRTSFNKGKKVSAETYEKMRKTFFKPGNLPKNTCKIGTEKYVYNPNKDSGYWFVKVASPDVWKLKHHIVWESVHGKIPEGYRVIFLDKDTNNVTIENLRLITVQTHAAMNNIYGGLELTSDERNICLDVISLSQKIKSIEKR